MNRNLVDDVMVLMSIHQYKVSLDALRHGERQRHPGRSAAAFQEASRTGPDGGTRPFESVEEPTMASPSTTPTAPETSRAATIALWVGRGLMAVLFVRSGITALAGAMETELTFEQIGAGQWLRYAVGLLEVAGAIGLLIPRLSGLAAIGLAGIMAGAVFFEATVLEPGSIVAPLVLMTLVSLLA
jgi:putative oxidoreductase